MFVTRNSNSTGSWTVANECNLNRHMTYPIIGISSSFISSPRATSEARKNILHSRRKKKNRYILFSKWSFDDLILQTFDYVFNHSLGPSSDGSIPGNDISRTIDDPTIQSAQSIRSLWPSPILSSGYEDFFTVRCWCRVSSFDVSIRHCGPRCYGRSRPFYTRIST